MRRRDWSGPILPHLAPCKLARGQRGVRVRVEPTGSVYSTWLVAVAQHEG